MKVLSYLSVFCTVLFVLSAFYPEKSWADCQSRYQQAKAQILHLKQQALNNQSLNKDTFQSNFQESINQLQSEGCTVEILNILQFVQNEQKLYPNPQTNGFPQTNNPSN